MVVRRWEEREGWLGGRKGGRRGRRR